MPYLFPNIYQKLNQNPYNIPIANPNHITPATTTTVIIIIAKANNILMTNTLQYPNQNI